MYLTDSVKTKTLKSVGEQRCSLLNKLGIYTISDLIEYFPRDYLDRSRIYSTDELTDGQMATIMVQMAANPQVIRKGNITITKITFADQSGTVELIWFNQPYMQSSFKKYNNYFVSGRAVEKMGRIVIENPEWEIAADTSADALSAGRIVPVYSLTSGISQKILRSLIKQAIDGAANQIKDFMPNYMKDAHKLCDRQFAITNIHFPKSNEAYFLARRRLVFEELFFMQGALLMAKGYVKGIKGQVFDNLDASKITDSLPYNLTDDQIKVVNEISRDFASGSAANRLIQGDVGSGKTAVAMIMCYTAIQNGTQAAVMAPTETLAAQHYHSFSEIFNEFGVKCELLVGSLKAKEKADIKKRLISGEIDIIIGTHALIQDSVEFVNLGLVITDEQHRFGVRQRIALNKKGEHPHVLVMTATPIPRSLAMVLYGDMDISVISQMPPGRQKIDTFCVTKSYHQRIFKFIRDEVEKGHQAYIICPLIEESENEDFKEINSVIKFAQELKNGTFSDMSLEVLHGRMKPDEKNKIMTSFAEGHTRILISTTVIEVGINVPNATVILIENAERFGLSQLHQLRGRVGRSDKKSYCILITDAKNNITKQRMDAMVKTGDGFELSELDLALRGPGEFFGTMQHGIPQMRLANLYKDMPILEETKEALSEFFSENRSEDEKMFHVEHQELADKMKQIFGNIQNISL